MHLCKSGKVVSYYLHIIWLDASIPYLGISGCIFLDQCCIHAHFAFLLVLVFVEIVLFVCICVCLSMCACIHCLCHVYLCVGWRVVRVPALLVSVFVFAVVFVFVFVFVFAFVEIVYYVPVRWLEGCSGPRSLSPTSTSPCGRPPAITDLLKTKTSRV